MEKTETSKIKLALGEWLFVAAGLLFLVSTAWIASGGSFVVLLTAKVVYLSGLILLLLNK